MERSFELGEQAELIEAFEMMLARENLLLSDIMLQVARDELEQHGFEIAKRKELPTGQGRAALIALALEDLNARSLIPEQGQDDTRTTLMCLANKFTEIILDT